MNPKINISPRPIVSWVGIVLLCLVLGFSEILNAQDWTFIQTPISSSGGAMNSMYFLDKNTGWIVGNSNQGDIIHTMNGGTAEASKSYFGEPICETIMAGDINGDCKADWQDLAILCLHWLELEGEL